MKILALVAALALAQAQGPANVAGRWQWQGSSGWQRIELNLKVDGTKLSGLIRMGPGAQEPASPSEFWEYFFDPVDFKISNGRIAGNQIGFEQIVVRPAEEVLRWQSPLRSSFETRFIYTGVVQGDQILMRREVVPDKKDPLSLGNHKVDFILQRVK